MAAREKPKLRSTKDYRMFELHPHNRDVQKTKLLEKSMSAHGYDEGFPIRCIRNGAGKLKITHGHHRFHMARKLGLAVWFIEANNHSLPLFDSEASTHSWNVRDYVTARARAGEPAVEKALAYHEKTGIPLTCALSLVGGQGAGSDNKSRDMKKGTFSVGNMKHANDVAKVVAHCKECGVGFATSSYFVKAISKCLYVDAFDAEIFIHKVSAHAVIMELRRNVDDYLDLIEMVYNRKSRKKLNVAWMAKQASIARCPAQNMK